MINRDITQIIEKIKTKYLKEHGNVLSVGEYLDLKQKLDEIRLFLKQQVNRRANDGQII